MRRLLVCKLLAALSLALGGCAAGGTATTANDPYESFNRGVYKFNDAIDKAALKPVARGYQAVVPQFARTGVSNFFGNLQTPRSAINNLLQGKPGAGGKNLLRFLLNSTAGVGGLIDVATDAGLPEQGEDFGQTFVVWGLPRGPYVYLPFFGPHTMSDVVALPFDFASDPFNYYDNTSAKDKLRVLRIIDIRARLLSAEALIGDSKDPYVALREAYLQNREYQIYDGDPPVSQEDEDLFEEFLNED